MPRAGGGAGCPGVAALMAAAPPVYVYSPEYVAVCDSLCKVPKRVSAAPGGWRGLGGGGCERALGDPGVGAVGAGW